MRATPVVSLRRYSLRISLFLLVAICVLPAVVVSAGLVAANYLMQRDMLHSETVLLARKIAADLDRELSGVESGLKVLATSRDLIEGNFASFHQRASDALKSQIVYSYVLTDREGRPILNTLVPYGTPLPLGGTPAELPRRVFEERAAVLTGLFDSPVARRPLVAMGVPVYRGEDIAYSLDITLTTERVGAILARQKMPTEWVVAVLDSAGTIVGRSRDPEQFVGQQAMPELRQHVVNNREGSLEAVTRENSPVIASFSRSSRWPWTVVVGAPKELIEAEAYRLLSWAAVGLAISFLVGGALALSIARRVTSSVRGLNDAALALGAGQVVELPPVQLKEADAVGDAIVQASRLMARVRHQAHHDPLTGLANRALFDEAVNRQLALALRNRATLALLAIDLDEFKAVNDRQGHATGDVVLKVVAARIVDEIRASDLAARIGGDEFLVLLPGADQDSAVQTAERLVAALSRPYPGVHTIVSASVGIAVFPPSGGTVAALRESADRALYRAKSAGKRRAVLLDEACG
jgi:diguanylate cyclase (GGDEF)-like protein